MNIIATNLHFGRNFVSLSSWFAKTIHTSKIVFHRSYSAQFITSKYLLLPNILSLKRDFMDLSSVIKILEDKVPTYLAESWDNTGLLIDSNKTKISSVLFTNDLTEAVLDEALAMKSNLIISYHPPIFSPIKSLKYSNWKERIVMKCIENSIAVYSPHTSCDAVAEGVNDWLINCFVVSNKQPVSQSYECQLKYSHYVDFTIPCEKEACQLVQNLPDSELCSTTITSGKQNFRLKVNKVSLNKLLNLLICSGDMASVSVTALSPMPIPNCGMGRIGTLVDPLTLGQCINMIKTYLNLDHIRVAKSISHSLESTISTIAVCAGSGSSVLKGVSADLYITGEMSHHDLLDANHRKTSVILCEHSNSERGYLEYLVESLRSKLNGVKLIISSADKDPVSIL